MAHVECIGTWMKSTLTPRNTGVKEDDGEIIINPHTQSTFQGKHRNTGADLINTSCDGVNFSFTRVTTTEEVCYSGKIKIVSPILDIIENGTFSRVKKIFDAAGRGDLFADSGDWTAEKPT